MTDVDATGGSRQQPQPARRCMGCGVMSADVTHVCPPMGTVTASASPCCWRCTPAYPFMLCCPKCGNKRCPRANDHDYACTGSNESGQQGSRYAYVDVPDDAPPYRDSYEWTPRTPQISDISIDGHPCPWEGTRQDLTEVCQVIARSGVAVPDAIRAVHALREGGYL